MPTNLVPFAVLLLATTSLAQLPYSPTSSGTGRAANPVSFAVKGIRLHMTPGQALPIMENLARTSKAAPICELDEHNCAEGVHFETKPCVSEKISALKKHQERPKDGKCIQAMTLTTDGHDPISLKLWFVEDLPDSPGKMRLWLIMFEARDLKTQADRKAFFSALTRKYGPPTWATTTEMVYCAETGPHKSCRLEGDVLDHCDGPPEEGCRFPSGLGQIGLHAVSERAMEGASLTLYDIDLATRSSRGEARMINETLTTIAVP